jgi:hypothetical protein
MHKLGFTSAFLVLALAVGGGLYAWSDFRTTDARQSVQVVDTLSPEMLAGQGLRAEAWSGSTDGFLSEDDIRRAAAAYGDPGEVSLVQLSQGPPGKLATIHLSNPALREAAEGPVWAVIFTNRPHITGASPDATVFINVRFFSPRSGESILGFESAGFEEDRP